MTIYESFSILCVTIIGFDLLRLLFKVAYNVLAPELGINVVALEKLGKWAVVTGATDGIGKAYAEALANKGISIILISRNQDKLDIVANEIESKYNVETKTIAADFTQGKEIYNKIEKQLQSMDIGVLINNVGIYYDHPEYYLFQIKNSTFVEDIIRCNIMSVINMCTIVLPSMVEKNKGVIVNISSMSALVSTPLITIYSATKAFVDKFSTDLELEYAKQGIILQCVLPGPVATKTAKIWKRNCIAPSPNMYVKGALKTIGVQRRTTGYYVHTLIVYFIYLVEYVSPHLCRWLAVLAFEKRKRDLINCPQGKRSL